MGMLGVQLTVDCSKDWLTGKPSVSMVKQQFADETNINTIVARFEKTGMIEHLNKKEPYYGDVSGYKSYEESLRVVEEADALFFGMDAKVRARFENDPAKMIEFLAEQKNYDEAVSLGMVTPKPPPPPVPEPVITPSPTGVAAGPGPKV